MTATKGSGRTNQPRRTTEGNQETTENAECLELDIIQRDAPPSYDTLFEDPPAYTELFGDNDQSSVSLPQQGSTAQLTISRDSNAASIV